jgi:small subunit ribosomal protein S9
MFSGALTTARYRRMITVLTELEESARIAAAAGYTAFAEKIQDVLAVFERSDKANVLSRTARKHVPLDRHGRSYTVGKRKESAARVWMIPVREPPSSSPTSGAETATASTTSADADTDLLAPVVDGAFTPSPAAPPRVPVTTTTILVNNVPLNQFFPSPTDRERVVRPLKLAGVVGAFNVFSIVRGGGTSGQAGAVAHGIAQGIVAHVPEVDPILRKGELVSLQPASTLTLLSAKLMKRDPRMVERKKTGLAKARKRVRRVFFVYSRSSLRFFSTPGLSVDLDCLLYLPMACL